MVLRWLDPRHWARARRRATLPPDLQRAWDLIAAIDAGGVPLNPARVNQIARGLGLEVARDAPLEQTVQRIRAVLQEAAGRSTLR